MLCDMKAKLDPSQISNIKVKSFNLYMMLMIHRISTALDSNYKGEIIANHS